MPKLCRCGKIVGDHETCSCRKAAAKTHTGTTKERGYDHQHRLASERYRMERPLCERCMMLYGPLEAKPSKDMHHIHKIIDRPDLRMKRVNWLALCETHHEELERDIASAMETKRWSDANYDWRLNHNG